jgi:hypothetical protein
MHGKTQIQLTDRYQCRNLISSIGKLLYKFWTQVLFPHTNWSQEVFSSYPVYGDIKVPSAFSFKPWYSCYKKVNIERKRRLIKQKKNLQWIIHPPSSMVECINILRSFPFMKTLIFSLFIESCFILWTWCCWFWIFCFHPRGPE